MALQGCGFCNPARVSIAKMQLAGMSDKQIIDVFKKEYGDSIYRADPNSFFWVIPYGALGLGLLAIIFFLRQSFRPKTPCIPNRCRSRVARRPALPRRG